MPVDRLTVRGQITLPFTGLSLRIPLHPHIGDWLSGEKRIVTEL